MLMLRVFLLCLIVLPASAGCASTSFSASSRSLASYRASGMEKLTRRSYLLVNDTKVGENGTTNIYFEQNTNKTEFIGSALIGSGESCFH